MKKERYRMFAGMILVVIISSIFFCVLYKYNNKYTHPATQALNGLLVLSEADLETNPNRYLWNDWSFYPKVLLTPDDFIQQDPERYMTYVNIDSSNRMELYSKSDQSRYGYGTYVMRCKLPSGKSNYALYMPEIYSAYDMYINNEHIISVGNPDPSNYKDATANRMVNFSPDENGMAIIIIAVNNQSHIYSGMIYPPAFGTPESLNLLNQIRLGLHLCVIFSFVLSMLISLYFWKKMHHTNSFYFFLLCFSMIGWMSYPVLHTILVLPILPFYLFEVLFCYLTLFMLVIMHNRICGVRQLSARVSNITAGVFCMIITLYILFSENFTDDIVDFVSSILTVYKIAIAGYLLVTSCIAAYNQPKVYTLLYVSVFFGVACIWDRILPEYDPILGGWFLEWVCMVLVYVVGAMLWHSIADGYIQNIFLKQQHHNMEKQLLMQTNYTHQLNEQMEERRRFVHDFRQHLNVLHTMAEHSSNDEIIQYLDSVTEYTTKPHTSIEWYSGRPAVDALLNYYQNLAQSEHIHINIQFFLPDAIPLTDVELCTLLGNLLENAIDACNRVEQGISKKITVTTATTGLLWYMTIENTFDGSLRYNGKSSFLTRKSNSDYHGIGLSSVCYVLEMHNGTLDLMPNGNIFRVGVSIPSKSC